MSVSLARLRALWRNIARRRRSEQDLHDEIQSAFNLLVDEHVQRGTAHGEARRAATLAFGGVEQVKEQVRDIRSGAVLESIGQDLAYAARSFRRNPTFTVVAVVTIALGIGATTTVFSVVSAVLWQPLPYPNAARLVQIIENVPAEESFSGRAVRLPAMTPQEFDWWRRRLTTVAPMAMSTPETRTMTTRDGTVLLNGVRVSPALFEIRNVSPLLGRWLYPTEERPGVPVVVLSSATWQRYFGDAQLADRNIVLDGQSYTVVGVMPPTFGSEAFWVPFAVEPARPGSLQYVQVTGLLKADRSLEEAAAEIKGLGAQLRGSAVDPTRTPRFEVMREQDQIVAAVRPALRILIVAVTVVLVIVCANVANLLLVRGAGRRREIAIRRALGASRSRLARQLLTESVMLSAIGGMAGVVLAYLSVQVLRSGSVIDIPSRFRIALGPLGPTILPRANEVAVDLSVLTFALGTSLVTGLMFGLAPALRLSRLSHRSADVADGPSHVRPTRVGSVLAVIQFALATTLLIGSGLLLHSFLNLSTLFLGFDPSTQIFQLISPRQYMRTRRVALAYDLTERLQALPTVKATGLVNTPPLVPSGSRGNFYLPPDWEAQRQALGDEARTQIRGISPRYLDALGVRLLEGRWLDERDGTGQRRVMLVNRAWAERFSPRKSSIGTTATFVTTGRIRRQITWEIIGVVDNVRWSLDRGPDNQPRDELPLLGFMDLRQLLNESVGETGTERPSMELDMLIGEPGGLGIAVRTTDTPLTVAELRRLASEIDPAVTVDGVTTMGRLFSGIIGRQRFYAAIVTLFAVVAAVIAAIGIYGVLAYATSQRTQEFGVRLALGAQPRDLLTLVMGQGMALIAIGVAAGVGGAVALTRLLAGMLFGVTPLDIQTYALVASVFVIVALVAAWVPARRAMKVNPIVALRYE